MVIWIYMLDEDQIDSYLGLHLKQTIHTHKITTVCKANHSELSYLSYLIQNPPVSSGRENLKKKEKQTRSYPTVGLRVK